MFNFTITTSSIDVMIEFRLIHWLIVIIYFIIIIIIFNPDSLWLLWLLLLSFVILSISIIIIIIIHSYIHSCLLKFSVLCPFSYFWFRLLLFITMILLLCSIFLFCLFVFACLHQLKSAKWWRWWSLHFLLHHPPPLIIDHFVKVSVHRICLPYNYDIWHTLI